MQTNVASASLSPVFGSEQDTYFRLVYGTQSVPFGGMTPGSFYDLRALPVPYVAFDKSWFQLLLADDTFDGQLATVNVTRENNTPNGSTLTSSITLSYPLTIFGVHLGQNLNKIQVLAPDGTELANLPVVATRWASFLYAFALETFNDAWQPLETLGTTIFGALPVALTAPLIGFDDYLPHASNINEISRLFVVDALMNKLGSSQGIATLSQALLGSAPVFSKPKLGWIEDAWANGALTTAEQTNGQIIDLWAVDATSARWANLSRLFWNLGHEVTAGDIDVSVDGNVEDFSALEQPIQRTYDAGSEWIEMSSQVQEDSFDFWPNFFSHGIVQAPGLFDYTRSHFDTGSEFDSNHEFDTVSLSLDPANTGFVGDAITPGPVFYSDDSVPMGVLSLSSASFGFPIESVVLASEEITNELILPGFTLGTGWTTILSYFSSFGFSHVAGNTAPVVGSTSFVSGDTYDIEWVVTRTSGSITIAVGGWSQSGITASGTANETLTTQETLTITPTSDFVGTIFVSITYWSGTLVNTVFDFSLAGNSGYLALLVGVNS